MSSSSCNSSSFRVKFSSRMSITIVILSLALLFGLSVSDPRRKYGESCPADDWCDYGKWLWCQGGTCGCLHPHRQTFDLVHNRCVAQVGTECNVYIGDRDCTANSFCDWHDGKGRCKCKAGFTATSQRTCFKEGQIPNSDLVSENEIVVPGAPAKLEGSRLLHEYSSSTARPRYSVGSSNTNNNVLPRANTGNSLRSSLVRDSNSNSDIEDSWSRLWTLLLANRNTGIFFEDK